MGGAQDVTDIDANAIATSIYTELGLRKTQKITKQQFLAGYEPERFSRSL